MRLSGIHISFPATLALAAVLVLGAPALGGDLQDAVPADAYLYLHGRSDPAMEVIEGYYAEVFQALLDARLDDELLNILSGFVPAEELEPLRQIRDLASHLLGSVPWGELGKHEMIFAEVMRSYGIPTGDGMPDAAGSVALLGMRVDTASLPQLHAGLMGILQTVVAMAEGNLVLQLTVRDSAGTRTVDDPAAMAEAAGGLGTDASLSYRVGIQASELADIAVAVVAFQGEHVLFGFAPTSDELVETSLASLRGEAGASLADSPRFQSAFEGLPEGGHERFYMDFEALFAPIRKMTFGAIEAAGGDPLAVGVANDLFGLLDCLSTTAYVAHVEGYEVIQDVVFRFKDEPATRNNPIYLVAANTSDTRGLLEYVPADATDFTVSGTFDLVPLYKWICDRVASRVPEGDKALAAFTAAQALMALDLERELLPLLGSECIRVTLPPRSASPLAKAETVRITRPTDLAAAKRLSQRLDTIVESLVPVLMTEMSKHPELGPLASFRVEVGPSRGAFPTLKQVQLTTPFGGEEQFYGYVGGLAVSSSSEEALAQVLETIAGEQPNITEGPALPGLPGGPLAAVSLSTVEGMAEQFAAALQMAPALIGGLTMGIAQEDPEAAMLINGVARLLPKIGAVVGRADFTKKVRSHTEKWDDGLTWYTRLATLYKSPEERAASHAGYRRG